MRLPSLGDPVLRIHLFGQPRFFWSGESMKFVAPPRTLPLLAFLLLNRDAHLTRDTLAFTLWPDETEEVARTNLRRHLNYLKNALPRECAWFVADGDTVGWNEAGRNTWLDVTEFETLVARGETLEEAVDLYAGDLLPALYDDWIIVTRDRLRSTYLGALDALLLRARSDRSFATAAGYARRILAEDPWREDALRGLISIRYESGDRTGALLEYDDFARRLERDVGVEPMPETIAVRDLVLRGAPLPESAGALPDEGESRGLATFGFVGRGPQLEQLRGAWQRAARGRGAVVLLGGEAGIGKSRLAAELALFTGTQGGRVLRGTTGAPEGVPYQALAEALRAAVPMLVKLDVRPIWLAALAVLVPEIATARTDLPPLPALDPKREQSRLFEALAATFSALGKQRPLLVILEDIHWAGVSTLAALEYLTRRAAASSYLIVSTYRSEDVDAAHALGAMRRTLASENLLATIALGGLSTHEVRAVVAQVPELSERSESLATRIHTVSDGNPLFTLELVRDILERGEDHESGSELRATIEARLARLGERSRLVAEIASVAGMTFDVETVRDVAGWSEHELFEATGDLLDRRIIREVGHSSFSFVFSHHLIASALYHSVPSEARERWHMRLATILERTPGRTASATLAYHLAAAGANDRAARAYLAAGREAFAVYANAEACELASTALRLHATDDDLRFELLALRERIFERLGDLAARGDDLAAVERLAEILGGDERLDGALQRRIDFEHARGERKAELEAILHLRRRAETRADARALAAAREAEANYRRSTAEFDEACRLASEARDDYERLGDAAGEARALTIWALSAGLLGRPEARSLIDRAIVLAEGTQDAVLRSLVLRSSAGIAQFRQDYRRLAETSQQTLDLARSAGDRHGEAVCHHQIGTAYWTVWRVREAHEHLTTAVRLCEELGTRDGIARTLCNLGAMTQDSGLYDEAEEIARRAQTIAREIGADDIAAVCEMNLGLIAEQRGDLAAAKRCAERALTLSKRLGVNRYVATSLAQRGMARRKLGELEKAISDLRAAVDTSREAGRAADATEWLPHLALAYIATGRSEEARGTIDEARRDIEGETQASHMMYPTHVYWSAAQVYRACGESESAATALTRAREEFERRKALLPDERWQAAFAAISTHREITAACDADRWP
jgi:DNA-binding SARP family transcriptional activator/tetratricopeptide (TPR) repeat protein